ncbi:PEP-CTERM sorting domain-containing protein [Pleurocapsales cyanobacterium LEGE 06147]|nr:PEP-CTERM sorting domain-containing protein [Pleurocapsales cyanobacterium LEGE 06147]
MKNIFSTLVSFSVLACGSLFLAIEGANALTFGGGTCNVTDVKANINGTLTNSTSCIGQVSNPQNDVQSGGNPLLGFLNDDKLFGNFNWSFAGKQDIGKTQPVPFEPGTVDFGFSVDPATGEPKNGTWNVTQALSGPFVISLKAATGWAAYFFENADEFEIFQGTWATTNLQNPAGKQAALSHISLFVADTLDKPHQSVPEPATTAALGLFALGSFGFRYNKKS